MQNSFGRPYPAPVMETRILPPWTIARSAPGALVLILTYVVASFVILAAGLTQSA